MTEARNHQGPYDERYSNLRFHRYPNNIEMLLVMTWHINYNIRYPKIDYQGKYRHWFKIGEVYLDQFDLPTIEVPKFFMSSIMNKDITWKGEPNG